MKTHELGLEIQRWERLGLHAANARLHPMVRRSHGGPPPFGVGLGVVRVSLADRGFAQHVADKPNDIPTVLTHAVPRASDVASGITAPKAKGAQGQGTAQACHEDS